MQQPNDRRRLAVVVSLVVVTVIMFLATGTVTWFVDKAIETIFLLASIAAGFATMLAAQWIQDDRKLEAERERVFMQIAAGLVACVREGRTDPYVENSIIAMAMKFDGETAVRIAGDLRELRGMTIEPRMKAASEVIVSLRRDMRLPAIDDKRCIAAIAALA